MKKNILFLDKPPFVLAVFFAITSWAVVRYADKLDKAPIIEYRITVDKVDSDLNSITVVIENITNSRKFTNIVFRLRGGGSIEKSTLEAIPPAFEHSSTGENRISTSRDYVIKQFHPGWKIKMAAQYIGNERPEFVLYESEAAVKLLSHLSIEALIYRYQVSIIVVFLLIWGVFSGYMLIPSISIDKNERFRARINNQ